LAHSFFFLFSRFQNGVVLLVSFANGGPQIIQRLKGHEEEIQCLRWSGLLEIPEVDSTFATITTSSPGEKTESSRQNDKKAKKKGKRKFAEISTSDNTLSESADRQKKSCVLLPPSPGDRGSQETTALVQADAVVAKRAFVVSASRDRTLRIWDSQSGQPSWMTTIPRDGNSGDQKARQWTSVEWASSHRLELLFFAPKFVDLPLFLG
jgi:WD40 repeat protein